MDEVANRIVPSVEQGRTDWPEGAFQAQGDLGDTHPKQHGGTITAESEVNEFTEFVIILPHQILRAVRIGLDSRRVRFDELGRGEAVPADSSIKRSQTVENDDNRDGLFSLC